MELKPNKAVCFDFDGVIHRYREGWKDGSIYDEENYNVVSFISNLMKHNIPVFICSTRDSKQILQWWKENILPNYDIDAKLVSDSCTFWNDKQYVGITNRKLAAQVYIDDRAYTYEGQDYKELCSYFNM